jgi:hypothetical protein
MNTISSGKNKNGRNSPVKPGKNNPAKSDEDPDPFMPGSDIYEPDKTDPMRIDEPEEADPVFATYAPAKSE